MNKDLRDYLLQTFCVLASVQRHLNDNPLLVIFGGHSAVFDEVCGLRLRTAQIYKALADEKDFDLLDEDGWPTKFQIKRLQKMNELSFEEYVGKREAAKKEGVATYISMREGDLVKASKKEPSKCDDCGHVHD